MGSTQPCVASDTSHLIEDRSFGPQIRADAEAIFKRKGEASKLDYEFRDYKGCFHLRYMHLILSWIGRHCARLRIPTEPRHTRD